MILEGINKVDCFTVDDIAKIRNISSASARVYCSRKAGKGEYIRLKNNLYILKTRWDELKWVDQMKLANRIQVPSYVSLLTALAMYELTTQIPTGRIESIAIKRTYIKEIEGIEFAFIKIDKNLYRGFTRKDGLFIAEPEKALTDCIYLSSFGKYAIDLNALEWNSISRNILDRWLMKLPEKTQNWWKRYGNI